MYMVIIAKDKKTKYRRAILHHIGRIHKIHIARECNRNLSKRIET